MIYNQSRHRKETQKWNYQIRYGSVDNCKGRYSYTKFTRCWIAGTFFTLGTLHIVHQYTLSYAQLCNIVILFTDENKEVICINLVDKEVRHQGSRWNNKQWWNSCQCLFTWRVSNKTKKLLALFPSELPPPSVGTPRWVMYSASITPTFFVRSPWELRTYVLPSYQLKTQKEELFKNTSLGICLCTITKLLIQAPSMDQIILSIKE